MNHPFFYIGQLDLTQKEMVLDEDTSKHIVQVLRMKKEEILNLTNGKGDLLTCSIINDNKKHCSVDVKERRHYEQNKRTVTVAISLLKNTNRFEWFLEKVTEIGVSEIIPMICERTEKEKFRYDRMRGICISAMLQSQQVWLPELQEPMTFENIAMQKIDSYQKFIAHCLEDSKQRLSSHLISPTANQLILIGPEGDFTEKELQLALRNDFTPVTLGDTRLRSETAGVVAATLLVIH